MNLVTVERFQELMPGPEHLNPGSQGSRVIGDHGMRETEGIVDEREPGF